MSLLTAALAASIIRSSNCGALVKARGVFVLLCVATGPACDRASPPGTASSAPAVVYPAGLHAGSTPRQVAEAFVRALDANDEATLRGLAAVRAAVADVAESFRRHGQEPQQDSRGALAAVVVGWQAAYQALEPGATQVESDSTSGERATVIASATNRQTGQREQIVIRLVREDRVWKVLPEIHPPP